MLAGRRVAHTDEVELLRHVFSLGYEDGLDVNQRAARREPLVAQVDSLGTGALLIHTYIHKLPYPLQTYSLIYVFTYIHIHIHTVHTYIQYIQTYSTYNVYP